MFTGSPARFTYWSPGQPGTLGFAEDCVCMELDKQGGWDDYNCSDIFFIHNRYSFACEFRK
jgi:hypothetical protein